MSNPAYGVPWSATEDAFVRDNYSRLGAEGVRPHVNSRTLKAIQKRARRLGVSFKRQWTPEEDARLAELWGLHSTRAIAKRLGRGPMGVYIRASVRGLVARERDGMETLAEASKRCGYDARDMRRILRRAGVLRESVSRHRAGYKLRPSYQLDPFEVDEAVGEYVRGSSLIAAARARGVSDHRLRRALEKLGVRRPEVLRRGEQWRVSDELADRALGRAA